MNRLWFADSTDLAVYYLPVQTMTGTMNVLPLNAYFKRGGTIRAITTWTLDGGAGMNSMLVIFSTNGEAAIYSGADPDAVDGSFKLVGVYRFDSPMSAGCVVNYGGELYVLIATGLVPMSTLLKAEEDNLGTSDQNIMQEFSDVSKTYRDAYGWSVIVNSQTNHAICNMPIGSGKYEQLVRFMPNPIWSKWVNVPSRCWAWLDNHAYFGSENGLIYRTGREYLNDNGTPIDVDVRFAWSSFKRVNKKQFKLIRLYMMSDSIPQPFVDVEVDYATIIPTNKPDAADVNPAGKLEYRDLGCRRLGGRRGAAAEMAGRDRARAGRGPAHSRQLHRLDVLDHGRRRDLRRGRPDVKVHFGDLPPDAQAMLTRHLRIDFSPLQLQGAAMVLGVGAQRCRRDHRHLRHRVSILVRGPGDDLGPRPTLHVAAGIARHLHGGFRPSAKTDCRSRAGQSPGAAAGAAAGILLRRISSARGRRRAATPSSTACCGRIAAISPAIEDDKPVRRVPVFPDYVYERTH